MFVDSVSVRLSVCPFVCLAMFKHTLMSTCAGVETQCVCVCVCGGRGVCVYVRVHVCVCVCVRACVRRINNEQRVQNNTHQSHLMVDLCTYMYGSTYGYNPPRYINIDYKRNISDVIPSRRQMAA